MYSRIFRLFLFLACIGFPLALYAMDASQAEEGLKQCSRNKFAHYPVKIFSGAIAREVDFTARPRARSYRTYIRNALKGGVNFAGHYVLAEWGCGTNCLGIAIIDAPSGKVKFYSEGGFLTYKKLVSTEDNYIIPLGILHRADSNLLIINPDCDDAPGFDWEQCRYRTLFGDACPRYYRWNGKGFTRVSFSPNDATPTRAAKLKAHRGRKNAGE